MPEIPAQIVARTRRWFTKASRPLPWRDPDCTPWGVLVSEFMLQQTQVDRVLPRWQAWMERWPTPADLAQADLRSVLEMWDRLGYPRRARWLHECAIRIMNEHDGVVPNTEEALRALPGVGPYTAAAVCAFAYDQRTVVLDTNVRRVLARAVLGLDRPPTHITAAERELADELLPATGRVAAQWSGAVMELGALICTARTPSCSECPIRRQCAWRLAGYPASATPTRRAAGYDGSLRQTRGDVLAALRAARTPITLDDLRAACRNPAHLDAAVTSLQVDHLISRTHTGYVLGS
jgi:A/G-specific adenine glycosylase